MEHKIIVRNAVERKPGFMYSIDSQGNLIEEVQQSMLHKLNVPVSRHRDAYHGKNNTDDEPIQQIRSRIVFNNKNKSLNVENDIRGAAHCIIKRRLSKLQRRILGHLFNVENASSITSAREFNNKLNVERGPILIKKLILDLYGSKNIEAARHGGYVEYNKDYLALQKSIYRSVKNMIKKRLLDYTNIYSRRVIKLTALGRVIAEE